MADLPEIMQQGIRNSEWRSVVSDIAKMKNYSGDQLDYLLIDTELLMCFAILPNEYQKMLTDDMRIPKSESKYIFDELDKKVFVPIAKYVADHDQKTNTPNKNLESVKDVLRQKGNAREQIAKMLGDMKSGENK